MFASSPREISSQEWIWILPSGALSYRNASMMTQYFPWSLNIESSNLPTSLRMEKRNVPFHHEAPASSGRDAFLLLQVRLRRWRFSRGFPIRQLFRLLFYFIFFPPVPRHVSFMYVNDVWNWASFINEIKWNSMKWLSKLRYVEV